MQGAPTSWLRPIRGLWSSQAAARFRAVQREQYANRVRPFLPLGALLVPLAGLFDYLVTHQGATFGVRVHLLVECGVVAAVCAAGYVALRRAERTGGGATARVAAWLDPAITAAASFYLVDRVVRVGGEYAHLTAAASLMTVLFIRALVMPASGPAAAGAGLLVWLAYPTAFALHRVANGAWPPAPAAAGPVYGTVAFMFVVGLAVSSLGSHMLLCLRRSHFEATEAGRYRIERRLGGGGMGDVYLARHGTLKSACAIKVCRVPPLGDAAAIYGRFAEEARQASALMHPNIVRIFDYGEMDDGSLYYAMEYLPGLDMGAFLARFGPPPEERLLAWADQVLRALEEAHGAGVVHRDLKPENLFLANPGEPDFLKILDFGLARVLGPEGAPGADTRAGETAGSPYYMSPEQAQGHSVDARSDLYSLGAVLYHAAAGQPPFLGETAMSVLVQHLSAEPGPLGEAAPGVSPALCAVVARLLAKRPEDRFADAAAVRAALAASPRWGRWDRPRALAWWRDHAPGPDEAQAPDPQAETVPLRVVGA